MRTLILCFIIIGLSSCKQNTYVQGERLYEYWCANCHMEDGSGLVKINPPLAQADYLALHQDEIACIIRHGLKEPIVVNGVSYEQEMIAFPELSDVEITNIINYINHAWGNDLGERNIIEVNEDLKKCP